MGRARFGGRARSAEYIRLRASRFGETSPRSRDPLRRDKSAVAPRASAGQVRGRASRFGETSPRSHCAFRRATSLLRCALRGHPPPRSNPQYLV